MTISDHQIRQLEAAAVRVRENVIRMAGNGGCFVGSALSIADLLVYLYKGFLRLNVANPKDPGRDYLFLSKGHAVPALYGILAEIGLVDPKRLDDHLRTSDSIYWHPSRAIPGVEFHSGSLGHGLPVAIGVAMDCRLLGQDNRIVVIVGDGELNEGSNWEALLVASAYRLDNLIIIVDRNRFQANLLTERLIPLEPLEDKFDAFRCPAVRVDGHDFIDLETTFSALPISHGKPSVVIAETVRGRGLDRFENRVDRWFYQPIEAEMNEILDELYGITFAEPMPQLPMMGSVRQ